VQANQKKCLVRPHVGSETQLIGKVRGAQSAIGSPAVRRWGRPPGRDRNRGGSGHCAGNPRPRVPVRLRRGAGARRHPAAAPERSFWFVRGV